MCNSVYTNTSIIFVEIGKIHNTLKINEQVVPAKLEGIVSSLSTHPSV